MTCFSSINSKFSLGFANGDSRKERLGWNIIGRRSHTFMCIMAAGEGIEGSGHNDIRGYYFTVFTSK
jgi:hypothetical protein